jgi:hypothetical protein
MQSLQVKHLKQTFATQLLDNTIFTKPGPATEVDSITSQAGRFLAMACEKFSIHEEEKNWTNKEIMAALPIKSMLLHEIFLQ